MSDLPQALREALGTQAGVATPVLLREWQSDDGTRKFMLGLADGLYRAQSWGDVPERLAPTPHDPKRLHLSDGRCDPWGRFWTGCKGASRTGSDASMSRTARCTSDASSASAPGRARRCTSPR